MADATGLSRILTPVFVDLADSTALKRQRGDQAVGDLISRHRAHGRRLAAACGGRIIDWACDGCFLTFETPSAAVHFASRDRRAAERALRAAGLE
jgi:class 3 adenylate cyclase